MQKNVNEKAKICYTWKEKIEDKYAKDIKYRKVRDHCYYTDNYGVVHSVHLKHFVIKELAEKFEEQFICLGENTEKCITFSISIEKQVTKIV